MRKYLMFLALGSTALATPALARNGAWYVGGDFGAMIVEDMPIDMPFPSGPTNNVVSLDHDYGFDASLFVGYDLGAFRLEAETSYRRAGIDEIDTAIFLPGGVPPGVHPSGGNTSALSFMVNGLYDFGDEDGLSGFVGGGAGIGRVELNNIRVFSDAPAFLDDSDTRFAWQIVAGVRQAVSRNVDVTIRYRFFNVGGLTFDDGFDRGSTRFRSHSLLGGITFNFGAPPPPPVPLPPASPPPPQ